MTPRTDQQAADYSSDIVSGEFARTLERELNQSRAEVERLRCAKGGSGPDFGEYVNRCHERDLWKKVAKQLAIACTPTGDCETDMRVIMAISAYDQLIKDLQH